MKDSSTKFYLDGYLPFQLAALTHSITRSVAAVLKNRHDISLAEWKVMAIVAAKPELSAVDIAQRAQMDTVAVSRAVSKLMDRNLIVRKFGREDRRRSMLDLSSEGRKWYAEIAPLATELEEALLEDFSEEEKRVLEKTIRALKSKAEVFTEGFKTPRRRFVTQNYSAATKVNTDRFRRYPPPIVSDRMLKSLTR